MNGEVGTIYIIELARPLGSPKHHASYYVGWTTDVEARLAHHRRGQGSAMLKAAVERGIPFDVIATLPGTRDDERRIKRQRHHARLVKRLLGQSKRPAPFISVKHVDERFAVTLYRELLNRRYITWLDARDKLGCLMGAWNKSASYFPDVQGEIAICERRYHAVLKHVARAKSQLTRAQLEWYQQEAAQGLAASSYYRITTDEDLIADFEV